MVWSVKPTEYPLDTSERRALQPHKVRREDGEVTVSVPDDRAEQADLAPITDVRESIKVQALLAQIGMHNCLAKSSKEGCSSSIEMLYNVI